MSGHLATALTGCAVTAALVVVAQRSFVQRGEPASTDVVLSGQAIRSFLSRTAGFSLQTALSGLTLPTLQAIVKLVVGPTGNALVEVSRRVLFAGRQVVDGVLVPVFPLGARVAEEGDRVPLYRLAVAATGWSAGLSAVLYLGARLALEPVMTVWLGASGADVLPVAVMLLAGVAWTIPHIGLYQILSVSAGGRGINIVCNVLGLRVLGVGATFARDLGQVIGLYTWGMASTSLLTLGVGFWYLRRRAVGRRGE